MNTYNNKKAYKQLMGTSPTSPLLKMDVELLLCRGRYKFFFWLLSNLLTPETSSEEKLKTTPR